MGIFLWEHNSIKCAPFKALSLNKIPLLAIIPTGYPPTLQKPVIIVFP